MSQHMGHVVVCGYETGAQMLLDAIRDEFEGRDHELVIFARGERPADIPPRFVWIGGDPTKESELDKVRLVHASAVIIVGARTLSAQQADANTLLIAFTIRSYLNRDPDNPRRTVPLHIVAEILDSENVEHARTAGANEVIETQRLGFSLLAHAVTMPGTAGVVSQVAHFGAHSVYVGRTPDGVEFPIPFGRLSSELKHRYDLMLLGLRDPTGGNDSLNPPDGTPVPRDAALIYLAESAVLSEIGAER